eukprot:927671_1
MTCSTQSDISDYVTIAYCSLYITFLNVVSAYSFYFLMKYSAKFRKKSCIKKFKMWFMDIWKRRRCYVPLVTHIFDQITDYSVAIQFLLLAQSQYQHDWKDCQGLNIWYLFILTILSMAIYRIISSFLIYQFTKSITRIVIQLLDFELLRALYINYLCDNIEPCYPQRWLTTLEACLESSPQALIQMVYLTRTNTFGSSYLVVISLLSSQWSIISKLASDDKVIVIERAKNTHFKFTPLKITIDILVFLVWTICVPVLIGVGVILIPVIIILYVCYLFFCCCNCLFFRSCCSTCSN